MTHGSLVSAGWAAHGFMSLARIAGTLVLAGLGACATVDQGADGADVPLAKWAPHALPGLPGEASWQRQTFPGKEPTRYSSGEHGGRPALLAEANASVSVVRKPVHVAPGDLAGLQGRDQGRKPDFDRHHWFLPTALWLELAQHRRLRRRLQPRPRQL